MDIKEKIEALQKNATTVMEFLQKMEAAFPDATEIARLAFKNEIYYQTNELDRELKATQS